MSHLRLLAVLIPSALIAPALVQAAAPRAHANLAQTINPAVCTPFETEAGKVNDYRGRDSSSWMQFMIKDNYNNHTGPAVQRVREGELTRPVMSDLNFTLRGWPNHVIALQTLIQYTLGGGKSYEYPPIECYFEHAKRFRSDDIAVFLLEGQFYAKVKRYDLAEVSFANALKLDGASVDAHYNYGLLEFDRKNYDAALEHAQVAYAAGYPLPGLRKKLEDIGKWRDPAPRRTADNTPK